MKAEVLRELDAAVRDVDSPHKYGEGWLIPSRWPTQFDRLQKAIAALPLAIRTRIRERQKECGGDWFGSVRQVCQEETVRQFLDATDEKEET